VEANDKFEQATNKTLRRGTACSAQIVALKIKILQQCVLSVDENFGRFNLLRPPP